MTAILSTKSFQRAITDVPTNELPSALKHEAHTSGLVQAFGKKCGFCAILKNGTASNVHAGGCGELNCTHIKRRRVEKHASLAREGEEMASLYSLRFGQIKVIGREYDEHQVTGFHMPGDLIGLESIASGRHRFRLVALEDCEVCEIPVVSVAKLIAQHSALQNKLVFSFSAALDEAYNRAAILSMRSLDRRFAGFLLALSTKYSRIGYSGNSFRLVMTRGDIGSYLATSIESVSRLISRFNSRGAALIQGRTVDIINRPYLEALAGGEGETDEGLGILSRAPVE